MKPEAELKRCSRSVFQKTLLQLVAIDYPELEQSCMLEFRLHGRLEISFGFRKTFSMLETGLVSFTG